MRCGETLTVSGQRRIGGSTASSSVQMRLRVACTGGQQVVHGPDYTSGNREP